MKKWFILLLCVAMVLSLAACGEKDKSAEQAASEIENTMQQGETGDLQSAVDALQEAQQQAAATDVSYDKPEAVNEPEVEWTESNGGAVVTGYIGGKKSIILPDTLGGLPVTEIGSGAFKQTELNYVVCPASVKIIGSSAFYFCTQLVGVEMPGVESIGESAFMGDMLLREVSFPATLKEIGDSAFSTCPSLKSVSLPVGLTAIENGAFFSTGVEEITIPGSVSTLAGSAFRDCHELRTVTVEEGVTEIIKNAFSYDENLKTVKLPASVTSLHRETFRGCDGLKLLVPAGSYAEEYAQENNIPYTTY